MSGIGAVPASRFTRPLPHTPLNHFLRQTKGLLASGALDNEDAVYVVTPRTPSFDQAVAAIAFAFLQQQLDQSAHTQRRYVPVISAARKTCLDDELPELALALQAALVAAENVVFEDDEEYRTVNAYASKKRVVLVGGAAEIKGKEAWNEWLELHGAQLFGVIDTDNTLPTDIHDEQGGVNERLNVALFPPQAVRGSGEAEPSLASLVALWAKQQLANASRADEEVLTRELADLLLAAVLLETDNLAESKTNSADLGAVGWLNPRSSFQLQNQDDASVAPEAQESRSSTTTRPTRPTLTHTCRRSRTSMRCTARCAPHPARPSSLRALHLPLRPPWTMARRQTTTSGTSSPTRWRTSTRRKRPPCPAWSSRPSRVTLPPCSLRPWARSCCDPSATSSDRRSAAVRAAWTWRRCRRMSTRRSARWSRRAQMGSRHCAWRSARCMRLCRSTGRGPSCRSRSSLWRCCARRRPMPFRRARSMQMRKKRPTRPPRVCCTEHRSRHLHSRASRRTTCAACRSSSCWPSCSSRRCSCRLTWRRWRGGGCAHTPCTATYSTSPWRLAKRCLSRSTSCATCWLRVLPPPSPRRERPRASGRRCRRG